MTDLRGSRGPTSVDTVTSVGTATTVLRLGAFTLLTDPNFLRRGQRAYLGKGLWSRRRTDPALRIEQLPRLDARRLDRIGPSGAPGELQVESLPAVHAHGLMGRVCHR